MEMDMEMPNPDELEWMESHGLVPEEEEEAYFDDPDEGVVLPAGDSDQPCDSPQQQESAAPRASMQCASSLYIRTYPSIVCIANEIGQTRAKMKRRAVWSGLRLRHRRSRMRKRRGASGETLSRRTRRTRIGFATRRLPPLKSSSPRRQSRGSPRRSMETLCPSLLPMGRGFMPSLQWRGWSVEKLAELGKRVTSPTQTAITRVSYWVVYYCSLLQYLFLSRFRMGLVCLFTSYVFLQACSQNPFTH